ncbi:MULTISPECIES: Rv3235 family protein [unclassified Arthrobacter]|uniref:Rv3235 family protein n=1 Tax=unclassified Arthrobacter TaxID=235627 RepID=UPI001D15555D|nr:MULTISPECIES: Rv3235 family protein [unclassified Arthrobacter]MCC3276831.1 Rv3235 family protein [Arthrobacter sp. zg-Y20]MCC9176141.1 Rv3235 family protein [Arthrobacter sp. zg-Y750]MDK1316992.1 Rv3235 family protein [Arthrobacter sp. zg.Y20]WIB05294.1 Rv3235 family protein [Arthrobacter sp. zg-Y20]
MTSVIYLPAPEAPVASEAGNSAPPIAVYRAPLQDLLPAPVPASPRETAVPPAPAAGEPPAGPGSMAGPGTEGAQGTAAHWQSEPADDARVKAICQSVALAALEVLGGVRPLQQMSRWLDPENYERMQLRANLVRGLRQNPAGRSRTAPDPQQLHRGVRIRSCRICPVAEGIYEGAVVALENDRARAVALRVQLRRGLWRVTALEIG